MNGWIDVWKGQPEVIKDNRWQFLFFVFHCFEGFFVGAITHIQAVMECLLLYLF